MIRVLRESFIPLFGVLLGLVALTAYFDGRAEDLAKKETVIALSPVTASWDDARLSEHGMIEAAAGAESEESARPEVLAAREQMRRGGLEEARAILEEALAKAPGDAALEGENAVVALKQGKLELAAKVLDELLAREPDRASAHFNRALVATRAGDRALARRHYERAIALRPNDSEALCNLGLLELEEGRLPAAIAAFEAAVPRAAGMSKARALFSLGVARGRSGDRAAALASWDKAIEYAPAYLLPRYNQAVLLSASGEPADKERAVKLVAQLIALRPDFAPAWFLKGRMASQAGDPEAALAAYEEAAAHDPTFFKARYNAALVALDMDKTGLAEQRFQRLVVDFPDRPEPLFNLGRLAHRKEDNDAAADYYRKAIALRQGAYPEAQLNLAASLRAAGKLEEALATLDALLVAEPTMSAAELNRGLVLARMKRPDEARAALQKAIAMKADYASAWYNLGKLESDLGRHEESIAGYRKALEIDPKMDKAAVNLGVELADLERWDEAIAAYRQAIALAPDNVGAHFNLGIALRSSGHLEEAAASYQRVIELDEEHIAARRNLAVIYSKLGQQELAIRTYQQALEIDPSHVPIRYGLANSLRKAGRLDDARAEYQRVRRLDPRHRGAAAALAGMLVDEGNSQPALDLIAPFLAEGRASAAMRNVEGRARLALGDVTGAQAAFAQAKALAADDPDTERGSRDAEPTATP